MPLAMEFKVVFNRAACFSTMSLLSRRLSSCERSRLAAWFRHWLIWADSKKSRLPMRGICPWPKAWAMPRKAFMTWARRRPRSQARPQANSPSASMAPKAWVSQSLGPAMMAASGTLTTMVQPERPER